MPIVVSWANPGGNPISSKRALSAGRFHSLGLFDVLELDEFVHAGPGQLRQSYGIELLARNGKDHITGIDQRGQHHHGPLRFESQRCGARYSTPRMS